MNRPSILPVAFLVLILSQGESYSQMNHIRFSAPVLYGVEPAPGHISGADFNHDSVTDFVVSSILEGGGDLLISNASGQYARSSNQQDGEATLSITLDFNNDGWDDYAIVTNKGIRVVKNHKGLGWSVKTYFQYYLGFITTVTGPITICAADIDRDGYPEIATAIVEPDDGSQVMKIIGNQNGTLTEDTTSYPLTDGSPQEYLRSMTTGDYNDDGWPDIAVVFTDAKKMFVLLNDKNNGFEAPLIWDLGIQGWMVITEDFNRDGIADIAIGSQADMAVKILFSNGDGSFTQSGNLLLNDQLYSVGTADLDGDGDPDLFANSVDNLFTSWMNDGNGHFTLLQKVDIGAYGVGYGLMAFRSYLNFTATDLNGDDAIDLAGVFDGNQVGLVYNDGYGRFLAPIKDEFPLFAMDNLDIADFDHNGFRDILGFDGNGKTAIMWNNGNGEFTEFTQPDLQPISALNQFLYLNKCKVIDLDQDDYPDIIGLYHLSTKQLNAFVIQNLDDAYLATGHYFLNDMNSVTSRYPDAWSYYNDSPIGTADFNADGLTDFTFTLGDSLYLFHNRSSCQFEKMQALDLPAALNWVGKLVPFRIYELLTADVNHDQRPDVILNGESSMLIYHTNAAGLLSFAGEMEHPTDPFYGNKPVSSQMFQAADFNLDGLTDFVFPTGHYLGLSFLWGQDDGSFLDSRSPLPNTIMPTASDLIVTDLDADGRTDVVIVNGNPAYRGNNVCLTRNENDAYSISNALVYAIGDRPIRGLADDLNNDGLPDIVVQYDWKKIKILLNQSGELPVAVGDWDAIQDQPLQFTLTQNYPNPFNSRTIIRYTVPRQADISISIYNALGQRIRQLVLSKQSAGSHEVPWDGRDDSGSTVSSGVYLCKYRMDDVQATMKLLFMK